MCEFSDFCASRSKEARKPTRNVASNSCQMLQCRHMFTYEKNSASKKPNAAYFIKTAVCVILFLGSMFAFAFVCRALVQNYALLFTSGMKIIIPLFIRLLISVFALFIMAAVVAVLVRPMWVAIPAYFVAAAMYPLIVDANTYMWAAAGVFALLMVIYEFSIAKNLKNQVEFSIHPLADMRGIFLTLLAALVAVAFGLGYSADSESRGYVIIPPDAKTSAEDFLLKQAGPILEQQPATPAQKQTLLKEMKKKMQGMMDDFEKKAQPFRLAVAIVLSVTLFYLLKIVFWLLGFILLPFLHLIFFILKKTRFTHEKIIKCGLMVIRGG